jgi:hypothetical protein
LTAEAHAHVRFKRAIERGALWAAEDAARDALVGHRSMATTRNYLHLVGVVFHDEASALERRLLGVEDPGRNTLEPAPLSGNR